MTMCIWLPMYWNGFYYPLNFAHHWCVRLSSENRLLCGALYLVCQLFNSLFLRLLRALRDLGKHFTPHSSKFSIHSFIIRNIILVSSVFTINCYLTTNLWKLKQNNENSIQCMDLYFLSLGLFWETFSPGHIQQRFLQNRCFWNKSPSWWKG